MKHIGPIVAGYVKALKARDVDSAAERAPSSKEGQDGKHLNNRIQVRDADA
jgi:hypothetical protein